MTPEPDASPRPLKIDTDHLLDLLFRLLRTPSPTGRTDAVMQVIGDELSDLDIPFELTRRGAMLGVLPGRLAPERAVIVHADTIGAMVREVRPDGRLELIPIGTWASRFAEGARVMVFTEEPDGVVTGTVLPCKASGHAFGGEVDEQTSSWQNLEVRLDARDVSPAALDERGVRVGCFVAVDPQPELTPEGFVVSRHLDGKAGVAAALAATRAVVRDGGELPHTAHLLITIAEEIGQGASHGLRADVAEMVSVDNAVCAPGQHSVEDGITIPLADMSGPFDYHLTRKLLRICQEHGLRHARDTFRYYRSDVAAAIESGAATRAALVAFGLDGSHGWERTHVDSVVSVAQLLTTYLRTPVTFERWDRTAFGPLREFPSSQQPVPDGA